MNAVEFFLSRQRPLRRADIVKIAMMTTGEQNKDDWQRMLRQCLPAKSFIKAMITGNASNVYQGLTKAFANNSAKASTSYGTEMEPLACKAYCELTGLYVLETGIWLFPSGVIGSAPDGLVYENDDYLSPAGVVEFKCPYNMRDKDRNALVEFAKKENKRHNAQVQGEIFATGLPWGDLVYWSPQGIWKKRIFPDIKWNDYDLPAMERNFVEGLKRKERGMFSELIKFKLLIVRSFDGWDTSFNERDFTSLSSFIAMECKRTDCVLEEIHLFRDANNINFYGQVFKRGNFTGVKVVRSRNDWNTGQQSHKSFLFSATLKELKEIDHNLEILVKRIQHHLEGTSTILSLCIEFFFSIQLSITFAFHLENGYDEVDRHAPMHHSTSPLASPKTDNAKSNARKAKYHFT